MAQLPPKRDVGGHHHKVSFENERTTDGHKGLQGKSDAHERYADARRTTARLAVRVIKGEGVVNFQGQPADTRVLVTCDGAAFSSKVVSQDAHPVWNLSCVFDLRNPDPLRTHIKIHVRSKISPWHRTTIGMYEEDLETFVASAHGVATETEDSGATLKQSMSQPAWINLLHKGNPAGRVLVQVHFVKDIQHRPLRVMAVTWNVGDVVPTDSLNFHCCFPNVASGVYDLVVVGAQEFPNYSVPKGQEQLVAAAHAEEFMFSEAFSKQAGSETDGMSTMDESQAFRNDTSAATDDDSNSYNRPTRSSHNALVPSAPTNALSVSTATASASSQRTRARSADNPRGRTKRKAHSLRMDFKACLGNLVSTHTHRGRLRTTADSPTDEPPPTHSTKPSSCENTVDMSEHRIHGTSSSDPANCTSSPECSQRLRGSSSDANHTSLDKSQSFTSDRPSHRSWAHFTSALTNAIGGKSARLPAVKIGAAASDPAEAKKDADADASSRSLSASFTASPPRVEPAQQPKRAKARQVLPPVSAELLESLKCLRYHNDSTDDTAVAWSLVLMGDPSGLSPAGPTHSRNASLMEASMPEASTRSSKTQSCHANPVPAVEPRESPLAAESSFACPDDVKLFSLGDDSSMLSTNPTSVSVSPEPTPPPGGFLSSTRLSANSSTQPAARPVSSSGSPLPGDARATIAHRPGQAASPPPSAPPSMPAYTSAAVHTSSQAYSLSSQADAARISCSRDESVSPRHLPGGAGTHKPFSSRDAQLAAETACQSAAHAAELCAASGPAASGNAQPAADTQMNAGSPTAENSRLAPSAAAGLSGVPWSQVSSLPGSQAVSTLHGSVNDCSLGRSDIEASLRHCLQSDTPAAPPGSATSSVTEHDARARTSGSLDQQRPVIGMPPAAMQSYACSPAKGDSQEDVHSCGRPPAFTQRSLERSRSLSDVVVPPPAPAAGVRLDSDSHHLANFAPRAKSSSDLQTLCASRTEEGSCHAAGHFGDTRDATPGASLATDALLDSLTLLARDDPRYARHAHSDGTHNGTSLCTSPSSARDATFLASTQASIENGDSWPRHIPERQRHGRTQSLNPTFDPDHSDLCFSDSAPDRARQDSGACSPLSSGRLAAVWHGKHDRASPTRRRSAAPCMQNNPLSHATDRSAGESPHTAPPTAAPLESAPNSASLVSLVQSHAIDDQHAAADASQTPAASPPRATPPTHLSPFVNSLSDALPQANLPSAFDDPNLAENVDFSRVHTSPHRTMYSSKSEVLTVEPSSPFAAWASSPHSPGAESDSAPGELLHQRAWHDDGLSVSRRKSKRSAWLKRVLKLPARAQAKVNGLRGLASEPPAVSAPLVDAPTTSSLKAKPPVSLSTRSEPVSKPTKLGTNAWDDMVIRQIGSKYLLVKSVSIGQMRLALFARNDMFAAVSAVQSSAVATGFGGVGTNKGGLAIAAKVWGNHLAFVNCHLAAHQTKSGDRSKMYQEIVKGLRVGHEQMDVLTSFHHLFWMGDLNYRLDFEGAWKDEESPSEEMLAAFIDKLENAIKTEDYSQLLDRDQLKAAQEENAAFVDFKEGDIVFPPTFKVERNGALVFQTKRLPAWCDRILWHSNMPLGQQPTCSQYHSSQAVSSSDHKPVFADLQVPSVSAPVEVVHDTHSHLTMYISSLKAEGLDQSKMMLTLRKQVQGVHAFVAAVKHMMRKKDECGIYISFFGDDADQVLFGPAAEISSHTAWKGGIKVQLKHAYHAHLKGRLLLINITYSTGRKGAEPRIIGRAVLPFCSVMPENADLGSRHWHHANANTDFPFVIQIYNRGVRAGKLSGTVRWMLKRLPTMPSMLDLMMPAVGRMSVSKLRRSRSHIQSPKRGGEQPTRGNSMLMPARGLSPTHSSHSPQEEHAISAKRFHSLTEPLSSSALHTHV